jgi:hypothetical protein
MKVFTIFLKSERSIFNFSYIKIIASRHSPIKFNLLQLKHLYGDLVSIKL